MRLYREIHRELSDQFPFLRVLARERLGGFTQAALIGLAY